MGHLGSYADLTFTAVVYVTLQNQKLDHLHYTNKLQRLLKMDKTEI